MAPEPVKNTPNIVVRVIIAALALFGFVGVLPVSLAELSSGGACPHLGPFPACHVVLLAYGTVLVSVLHHRLWNPWVFLLAWFPIFALAAAGSGLELLGQDTCPKTADGIPKCYFSLTLAIALVTPFIFHLAISGGSPKKSGKRFSASQNASPAIRRRK